MRPKRSLREEAARRERFGRMVANAIAKGKAEEDDA
jgi:hypothetical protein